MSKEYIFHADKDELGQYVVDVWKGSKSQARNHVLFDYIEKSHRFYYGHAWSRRLGTDTVGEQNEFSTISVNQSRYCHDNAKQAGIRPDYNFHRRFCTEQRNGGKFAIGTDILCRQGRS